jgi:hypothetical protein
VLRTIPPAHSPLNPQAIVGALRGAGDPRAELERLLRAHFAADRVALLGSGTQALQLALELATRALGKGAAVALPCYGCYDIASAAVGAGAPVRFYDLDPETLAPEPESVAAAVRAGARVLVVAPLFGMPVALTDLIALVKSAGGLLIEDAAQGQGGRWDGRPIGATGDLSVLSFGRGKGWTGGGGGALLIRGIHGALELPAAEAAGAALLAPGRALAQWALGRPSLYGIPARIPGLHLGETLYRPPLPPRAISPYSAALALATWGLAEREAEIRRRQGARLRALVEDEAGPRVRLPRAVGEPGYLRFPVLRDDAGTLGTGPRARALGIVPSYPLLLPTLGPIRHLLQAGAARFPGGETLRTALLTAPVHSMLGPGDLEAIARVLAS